MERKPKTHALQPGQERLLPAEGGHDWHGQTIADRRCWCGARWTLEGVTVSYGIKPFGRCPVDQVAWMRARVPNRDRDILFAMPVVSTNSDVEVLARGDIYFRMPMAQVERREAFEDASIVETGIGYAVYRNVLEAYIEVRARRDRFGEAPIHRDPSTGRILVGELPALMSWRWDDGGWKELRYYEFESAASEASRVVAVCQEIRAALRRRSGKDWSVTHGRGTSHGFITIDAPPGRRRYDWPGTAPAENGNGYASAEERRELLQLLGYGEDVSFHPQGLNVGSDANAHLIMIDRAHGRLPRIQESR